MTQEEQKNVLIKDTCGRLPYGVKARVYSYWNEEYVDDVIVGIDIEEDDFLCSTIPGVRCEISLVKPYLIPLSCMTEEQYDEMEKIVSNDYMDHMRITNEMREKVDFITHWPLYSPDVIDWFNRNHFDYRGLIEMGLALKAPDGMYNQNI